MIRRTAISRHIQMTAAMLMFACALAVLSVASSFAQSSPASEGISRG